MKSKKISVIVPAYNSQNTIEKCINSIKNQKYQNLEMLVVNDGSADNTENIVKEMQKSDSRIRLINIPNGGVSHARNVGIDNATGDLITFVDSDDFIDSEMYEALVDIIDRYNVQIAHCSYKNIDSKGNVLSIVGNTDRIVEQNHDEAMECLIKGQLFIGGLCNKLYDARLFENVRLDETIKFNEDILVNFYLFDKVNKSVYTDAPFYNYVALETSSTHTANSIIACSQGLFVSKMINKLSEGKTYEYSSQIRVGGNLLGLYRVYIFSKDKNLKKEKKVLMKEISEFKSKGFYKSRREKLLLFLYKYFPRAFTICYSLYDKIRVKKLDPEQ